MTFSAGNLRAIVTARNYCGNLISSVILHNSNQNKKKQTDLRLKVLSASSILVALNYQIHRVEAQLSILPNGTKILPFRLV